MKTAVLLITCVALFFAGGAANAFSICPMNMDKASAEAQMDDDMHMPCHNTEESQEQNSGQCDGCNCLHCVQINALSLPESIDDYGRIAVGIPVAKLLFSCKIGTLFHPPKQFS